MPASPVGCIHCSLSATSEGSINVLSMSTKKLVSTTIGAVSNAGGCSGVMPSPSMVRMEPLTNITVGVVSSISPRARRLGIGCRSGLNWPIAEIRLNGHSADITGKASGIRWLDSTSNASETKMRV